MNKIAKSINSNKPYDFILVITIFFAFYYILKLPIQAQAILHYDDAETLYHVLSMRYGRVPHLEDASHHSLGYILPFYLLSFFFGFSEFLLRQSAFIIQALAALGVFLTVRIYQKRDSALITSLLFLSAREPWVNAFYPQYIFNLIFVWVLYFLVTDIHANRFKLSRYAFLLCGIGFVFDQRLLFLTILPLCLSFTGLNLISLKNSLKGILYWILPVLIWGIYLLHNNALSDFITQAFLYPLYYRSASLSFIDHLRISTSLQLKAIELSPIFFTTSIIGFCFLLLKAKESVNDCKILLRIALSGIFFVCLFTSFGGRDFNYYTIIWFPLLAFLTAHSFEIFQSKVSKKTYLVILFFFVIFPLMTAYKNRNWLQNHNYQGDGAEQISFIIKDKMQNSDSLLVWHSRFEPYVYLKTLASTKFASSIFFKPDGSIQAKNTDKHLLQTYEKEFVKETNKSSPDWILLFKREGLGSNTFTDNYIRELLDRKYLFVKRLKGIDLLGKKTSWELYSLKN